MRYHARFIFVQDLCASSTEKLGVFCFIEPHFIDRVYEDLLKISFILFLQLFLIHWCLTTEYP